MINSNDINYKKLLPIFGGVFKTAPLFFPLCEESEYYDLFSNVPQSEFQKSLNDITMQKGSEWSVSGYLENRATILKDYPQMVEKERFYHLGIDIHALNGTQLYAPFDCEVVVSKYEEGGGNYGGITILKCKNNETEFYMLFGHLNPNKLQAVGSQLKKGDVFAEFGDMDQNGNWFYHTHLQILTQKAFVEGWENKGYCAKHEIETIDEYCPNPYLFL